MKKIALKHLKIIGMFVLGWLTANLIIIIFITGDTTNTLGFRGLGVTILFYYFLTAMVNFMRGPNK